MEWWSGGVVEWRSGGVVEWWSGGVVEWWSGGVVEWWSGGVVEWWSGGVVEWWSGGVVEWWSGGVVEWWSGGRVDKGVSGICTGIDVLSWFSFCVCERFGLNSRIVDKEVWLWRFKVRASMLPLCVFSLICEVFFTVIFGCHIWSDSEVTNFSKKELQI